MQKNKRIGDTIGGIRLMNILFMLLFAVATALLASLFIKSLHTSNQLKEELNKKHP